VTSKKPAWEAMMSATMKKIIKSMEANFAKRTGLLDLWGPKYRFPYSLADEVADATREGRKVYGPFVVLANEVVDTRTTDPNKRNLYAVDTWMESEEKTKAKCRRLNRKFLKELE
jgi:hypothetical protein